MAKVKTVRQAYAVTLIIAGKDVAPGTAVTLPEDEADKIAAMFGVVPAVRSNPAPADVSKKVDLKSFVVAVEAAQAAYDTAKATLEEPDAGADELTVFEEAEAILNAAEQALTEAGSQ